MASVPNFDIDILAKAKRALDRDYAPSDADEYMSPQQLNYFRVLLLEWKKSILTAAEGTLQLLQDIYSNLARPDKELVLNASYDDHAVEPVSIPTNYYREIAYNLEHTIHHMALIRVGITEVSEISLPDNFGVASSTVKHRKQCAQ